MPFGGCTQQRAKRRGLSCHLPPLLFRNTLGPRALSAGRGSGRGCRLLRPLRRRRFGFESFVSRCQNFERASERTRRMRENLASRSSVSPLTSPSLDSFARCLLSRSFRGEGSFSIIEKSMKRLEQQLRSLLGSSRGGGGSSAGGGECAAAAAGDSMTSAAATMRPEENAARAARPLAATRFVFCFFPFTPRSKSAYLALSFALDVEEELRSKRERTKRQMLSMKNTQAKKRKRFVVFRSFAFFFHRRLSERGGNAMLLPCSRHTFRERLLLIVGEGRSD